MKTVQMTLEEELLQAVDRVVKEQGTTRSAFTRNALQRALARVQTQKLEQRHRRGYLREPVSKSEFSVWEKQQKWGDE